MCLSLAAILSAPAGDPLPAPPPPPLRSAVGLGSTVEEAVPGTKETAPVNGEAQKEP